VLQNSVEISLSLEKEEYGNHRQLGATCYMKIENLGDTAINCC